jgi:hypothetical protein
LFFECVEFSILHITCGSIVECTQTHKRNNDLHFTNFLWIQSNELGKISMSAVERIFLKMLLNVTSFGAHDLSLSLSLSTRLV